MMQIAFSFLCLALLQTLISGEMLNDCHYNNNCSDCISTYRDLESYFLNQRDQVDILTETFFSTGQGVAKFVRITYNSYISESNNFTNNFTEDDIINCTMRQSLYIWSDSPLYLLGPEPLFWFTLFAVNIPEAKVAIDLPCLCKEDHDRLLSRFTYLVRNYNYAIAGKKLSYTNQL